MDSFVASLGLTGVNVVTPRHAPVVIELFRRIHRCLSVKKLGFSHELTLSVWEVLLACAEGLSKDYPAALRHAMEFMRANVHQTLRLQEISESASLSVRQCTRLFQEHHGCAPVSFFIQQKMAVAENLVVNTAEPFKQVAAALGYDDSLYFSVQFKKHFGVSPRLYRERARGG